MLRTLLLASLTFSLFASCSPVLQRPLLEKGSFNVVLPAMQKDPSIYIGKLYIFGGLVVKTEPADNGSLIEAVYVPVDSNGRLKSNNLANGRFLALYPRKMGPLDPMVFSKGRKISLAGVFTGVREGAIEGVAYTYPVFEIKDLHLWKAGEGSRSPYPSWYLPYQGRGALSPPVWIDPFWLQQPSPSR